MRDIRFSSENIRHVRVCAPRGTYPHIYIGNSINLVSRNDSPGRTCVYIGNELRCSGHSTVYTVTFFFLLLKTKKYLIESKRTYSEKKKFIRRGFPWIVRTKETDVFSKNNIHFVFILLFNHLFIPPSQRKLLYFPIVI